MNLLQHRWLLSTLLAVAAAMPWYAGLTKNIVLYAYLLFLGSHVPAVGFLVVAAMMMAIIPLAVVMYVGLPVATVWTVIRWRQTPSAVRWSHLACLVLVCGFSVAYGALSLGFVYFADGDPFAAVAGLNAAVLFVGGAISAAALVGLARLGRDASVASEEYEQ